MHFQCILEDQHVLVQTNNTSAKAYVNGWGGDQSPCRAHGGSLGGGPPKISKSSSHPRTGEHLGGEIELRDHEQPQQMDATQRCIYDDLQKVQKARAGPLCHRAQSSCSRVFLEGSKSLAVGTDALIFSWPQHLLYVSPPTQLLARVLQRVIQQQAEIIVVALTGQGDHGSKPRKTVREPWRLSAIAGHKRHSTCAFGDS